MRKNYFFVILLLSLKILAQNPEIDPTFNIHDSGVYQQTLVGMLLYFQTEKL